MELFKTTNLKKKKKKEMIKETVPIHALSVPPTLNPSSIRFKDFVSKYLVTLQILDFNDTAVYWCAIVITICTPILCCLLKVSNLPHFFGISKPYILKQQSSIGIILSSSPKQNSIGKFLDVAAVLSKIALSL